MFAIFLKKILSLIIFLIFFITINREIIGQAYIYTPEGKPVYVDVNSEASQAQIAAWNQAGDQWVSDHTLNAARIGSASYVYNCHAYAWSVSEGGSSYWLNTPNEHGFWSDNSYSNDGQSSYISSSESEATHAAYSEAADHSVRKIQNSYPYTITNGRD
jgi:hypothetical protein